MLASLALLAVSAGPTNLDFSAKLAHWDNNGFRLLKEQVSSSDRDGKGRAARLARTVRVPAGVRQLRCAAALYRPAGVRPGERLDVAVETEDGQALLCQVFDGVGWRRAGALLSPDDGALREYAWDVSRLAGQRVSITLIDDDARPRCFVVSTGFEFLDADDVNSRSFATAVRRLERTKKLPRMLRYDSNHFMALSNAGAAQTEYRLYNCETMRTAFLKHFRQHGFAVEAPEEKLMVAVLGTQDGFESYMGTSFGSAVTGLYQPATNRLVVYDYGTNRAFVENMKKLETVAQQGSTDLERQRRVITFGRWVKGLKDDVNLSTMMHEAAHQLAFNVGLMNREADVPVWLAEGLATYCEPTAQGQWQGIGAANPQRAAALQGPASGARSFLPMRDLIRNDDWIRRATRTEDVVLGYAQSWALFRMLMEERPKAMKKYLAMVQERRTDDHRLADFGACFGTRLAELERRYQGYMRGAAQP